MIESMPGAIYFYDDKGRFLRWNRNFELVSGYSAAEVAAMHPLQFFAEPDRPLIEERIKQVFAEGEASVEAPFRTKAGRTIPYFFTGRRIRFDGMDCLVGMGIDISERKRAEEELRRVDLNLRQSEQKYRELVQNANSIILRWTRDGHISFINEFGQKFFGYREDELLGRHVMDTIVPRDRESSGRDLASLMEKITADPKAFEQNVNENIKRNGERVWISWTNKIYQAGGEVTEILSVGTDITELRQTHVEVKRLNEQLKRDAEELDRRVVERTAALAAALDRAEAADRTKSAFLATMSHELRTPLNSIIGFTGIILQGLAGPLNPEQTKQLGMVRTSARHLLDLINDVLDISKIEAGELEVRLAPCDVAAAVERVVASIAPLVAAKGLQIELRPLPADCTLVSDRRRVEQILLNLLNNAIKFTDQGGITVTVERSADAAAPGLAIRIADTGIGIKAADLPMLFQPFRQIDTGLARLHEGTGLGLTICQRLAGMLGGKIEVESEWGRGSMFTLTLPLERERSDT